jgi:hypothetical protein
MRPDFDSAPPNNESAWRLTGSAFRVYPGEAQAQYRTRTTNPLPLYLFHELYSLRTSKHPRSVSASLTYSAFHAFEIQAWVSRQDAPTTVAQVQASDDGQADYEDGDRDDREQEHIPRC